MVVSASGRVRRNVGRGLARQSRPWRITYGSLALVLVALLVWGLWPTSGPGQRGQVYPASRQRAYSSYSACLLTGASGLSDATAAQVWAGMRAASTRVEPAIQVRYTPAVGAAGASAVEAFVNTFAMSKCSLVVAVGEAQVKAVAARATAFPGVDFLAVGSSGASAANLAVLAPASAAKTTESEVSAAVRAAASGSFESGEIG